MANNRLVLGGFDELAADLLNLPAALATDGAGIALDFAEGARAEMHYPRRTGDLADGLVVETFATGPFAIGARVVNTSKHAQVFENGSQARHTALGAHRGSMPPGHVFVPAVMRHRRAALARAIAMVESHGLVVTGDA